MLERSVNLLLFCVLLRGSEGVLLQVRRGEGVHGDARSGYQALEVRLRRLSDPVIPPHARLDAHGHVGTFIKCWE